MNKITLLSALVLAAGLSSSHGQGTWTQKADFGTGNRSDAVGFSIGGKGYIGTGHNGGTTLKDFWEYDPANNTWTQKADFGGVTRSDATGFSIGSKGYLGTGITSSGSVLLKDFWEYNPGSNIWTQKADFAGGARYTAVGFSIGGKGYVGTGDSFFPQSDFWEYDPTTNTWTQKADFGGGNRTEARAFSVDGKGYVGTGTNGATYQDFWQYDPSSDLWTQKADFGGGTRRAATAFAIGSKGYMGTGAVSGTLASKDFWEYNPSNDVWTQKADFGGVARYSASGFSIADKGYIGTGTTDGGQGLLMDFWEYSPDGSGTTCDTPTSLSASNVTDTTATLQWDPVSEAVQYDVSYKVAGTSQFTTIHSTGNSTTISGLTPLTQYVWKVRTVCSLSPPIKSAYSAQVKFTTSNGCDVPTGLFSEPRATSAFLAWDTVDKAISYEIMYQVARDPLWATVRARGSFITLRGLTPRTTYYWKVKTICSDSPPVSSEYSAQESFFTFPR